MPLVKSSAPRPALESGGALWYQWGDSPEEDGGMSTGFERLSAMEYPGRLIILGRTPAGRPAALYAVTGRSPSSQARTLVRQGDGVWTRPTDQAVLKTGNPELLVYPAMLLFPGGIAVSNGRQTSDCAGPAAADETSAEILARALSGWEFEPDAPIFTPRISGCLRAGGGAALHIVRRAAGGAPARTVYEIPLDAGRGRMIATYAGPNRSPLPIWESPPAEVELRAEGAEALAEALYAALAPTPGFADVRVAAAAAVAEDDGYGSVATGIINRHQWKD
jgi:IMP cyclohydrolase